MHPLQRYVFDKIYGSMRQDKQFHFTINNVLRYDGVALGSVNVHRRYSKILPDRTNFYRVYTIGNLSPHFLNLLTQYKLWFKDIWVPMQEDANERNFFFQVHTKDGVIAPSSHVYYSFIDESALLIAVKYDTRLSQRFKGMQFEYLRVYSNYYFRSQEFKDLTDPIGIEMKTFSVPPDRDLTMVTDHINDLEQYGGRATIYYNGKYVSTLPNVVFRGDFVDVIYDQSILSVERYNYNDLLPFESKKDGRTKLALYRDSNDHRTLFKDDIDVYLLNHDDEGENLGVYFYKHRDFVVRNITNKDFSLDGYYMGNQLIRLEELTDARGREKVVDVITRYGRNNMDLIHNELKLNDLYKLPIDSLQSLMSNTIYTEAQYRVEHLENSMYFALMGTKDLRDITHENAFKALGYNAITKLYGEAYHTEPVIDVPLLYRDLSRVYEYDGNGVMVLIRSHTGNTYSNANESAVFTQDEDVSLYDRTLYLSTDGFLSVQMNDVPKEIEVYLNGHYLAYNIDYIIHDTKVYIQNNSHVDHTGPNNIHIRAYGVTGDVSEVNQHYDIGWIKNGVVSANGRYIVRDDKPYTVYVDGKLVPPSEHVFQEDLGTEDPSSPLNGRPYTVTNRYIDIDGVVGLNADSEYQLSLSRDETLSGLLSLHYGFNGDVLDQTVSSRYRLPSHLLIKVIKELLDGTIPESFYLDSSQRAITTPQNYTTLMMDNRFSELLRVDVIFQDLPFPIIDVMLHYEDDRLDIGEEKLVWLRGLIDFLLGDRAGDIIYIEKYFKPAPVLVKHFPLSNGFNDVKGGPSAWFERPSRKHLLRDTRVETIEEDIPVFLDTYYRESFVGLMLEHDETNDATSNTSASNHTNNFFGPVVNYNGDNSMFPDGVNAIVDINEFTDKFGFVARRVNSNTQDRSAFSGFITRSSNITNNTRIHINLSLTPGPVNRVSSYSNWGSVYGKSKNLFPTGGNTRFLSSRTIDMGEYAYVEASYTRSAVSLSSGIFGVGMTGEAVNGWRVALLSSKSRQMSSIIPTPTTAKVTRLRDSLYIPLDPDIVDPELRFNFYYFDQGHSELYTVLDIDDGDFKLSISERPGGLVNFTIHSGSQSVVIVGTEPLDLIGQKTTVSLKHDSALNEVTVSISHPNTETVSGVIQTVPNLFTGSHLTVEGWCVLSDVKFYIEEEEWGGYN